MNAQTKHTPGPWVLKINPKWHCEEIFGSDGEFVCSFGLGGEHSGGNARLIAAAPGLLDALQDILRIATAASIGVSGNAPRLERARAAIAKAVTP